MSARAALLPGRARLKRGVKAAVELCGGGDGAAITADRGRSVTYDWANLNSDRFPPVDCALALDEVAVAQDRHPPILFALAAELAYVAVRLPRVIAGDDPLTHCLIDASAEFGEIMIEVRDATRDGVIEPHEEDAVVHRIDDAITALVRMRAVVRPAEALASRSSRPP